MGVSDVVAVPVEGTARMRRRVRHTFATHGCPHGCEAAEGPVLVPVRLPVRPFAGTVVALCQVCGWSGAVEVLPDPR